MKKTGLLFIGLTIALFSNAQTLKFQGGPSISKLDWKLTGINFEPFLNEQYIGYSVFVGLDYHDKRFFNLSSNIGFIRKGGKGEIQLTDPNGQSLGKTTVKPTLDYLSINTMIDLKYRIKETVSPFLSIGPRFDYLVRSNQLFDGLEEMDELNKTSIGLILGGGLKYDTSKLQFGLRADYYLDFTKVADWTIENTGIGGEVTVNTFTINLTFGFKL